jgi:hypothetical protein
MDYMHWRAIVYRIHLQETVIAGRRQLNLSH